MENFDKEIVSRNLKAMRVRSGMTQQEAAEKLGVSVVTFRKYEKDPSKLSFGNIIKLSEMYGCLPRVFFMESQSPIWGN